MSTMSCSWAQAPDLSQNEDVAELYVYSLDVNYPYEALSYVWGSSTGADLDDFAEHEGYELLTDARPDDKIIILRGKQSRKLRGGHSSYDSTLAERFSLPYTDDLDLFRCSQTDLPDFMEWINFQQYENYGIYQQPSVVVLEAREAVTDEEIHRCSSAIGHLLQSRSVTDIQLSLLACYIVANSYRELNPCELATAVYNLAKIRFPSDNQFMNEERGILRQHILLKLLRTVLRIRKDLKVSFAEPSMKKFLQSVSLPGVERGHGTMAQLCLGEIRRFGDTLIVQPWHRFRKWFGSCSEWPLMKYATRYWSCHVREASPLRPDVTAHLFHIINHGIAGSSPSQTPVELQQRVVEMGYSLSKIYDLPCLTSLYENLGASGDLSILQLPTDDELQDMKLISYQPLPDRGPLEAANFPRMSQSVVTDMLPKFSKLQISSQGRHGASETLHSTSEFPPEDWEYVDKTEKGYRIGHYGRDSADKWNIITREDYDIC